MPTIKPRTITLSFIEEEGDKKNKDNILPIVVTSCKTK